MIKARPNLLLISDLDYSAITILDLALRINSDVIGLDDCIGFSIDL